MKKEEMVMLLKSAGVDVNAINLAVNAWEMGAECEREECIKICNFWKSHNDMHEGAQACFEDIQERNDK